MIRTPYLWIIPSLLLVLAACGGASKPTVKLTATATVLEEGQTLTLKAEPKGAVKVEFYKGSEKLGEDSSAPYEYSFEVSSKDDATLSFTAKAIAADNQLGVSEPVSVTVKVDKEAPKVNLSSSSSNLNAAGAVILNATASDNKGVVIVEFFKGADKLGEDITPADGFSFSINLAATDNGSLKYTAKAYDKKGNVGTSAEVNVTVDIDVTKPVVTLASNKATVTEATSITLTATASDDKGIVKVEFFLQSPEGTSKLSEDTQAPYTHTISFTDADNGSHTYMAKTTDTNGNTATSEAVTVNVDIDRLSPTNVTISANPTSLTKPGSITFSATASDAKGIAKVEFYKGLDKIGEDTTAGDGFSFQAQYSTVYKATDQFTAKAFDPSGNSTTSAPAAVVIDIDLTPPVVSLSSSSTQVNSPSTITLSATASDTDGIARVEFYQVQDAGGTVLLSTDTDGSDGYTGSVSYTALDNGSHAYTAKAFDTRGNEAVSAAVGVEVTIFYYTQLAPGNEHTCALGWDQKAYCWGQGNSGELGNGLSTNSTAPVAVTLPTGVSFSQVATNNNYSCALGSDSKAYCWGDDESGRLGNGPGSSSNVPTAVTMPSGVSFVQLALGSDHACAVDSDGKGYCWGYGGGGLLGDGADTDSEVPVAVTMPSGVSFTQIAAGFDHSCALGSDGKAYCWGTGPFVGDGANTNRLTPVSVTMPSGVSFSSITAGVNHTCALGSDNKAYCWGNGGSGHLGNNSTDNSLVPVAVSMPSGVVFSQIMGGEEHSCALSTSKVVYCWGKNDGGQLGNGTLTQSSVPVAVSMPSGITFTLLATTNYHTCAIGSDLRAYCWGDGGAGRLGNGGTSNSNVPVAVNTP